MFDARLERGQCFSVHVSVSGLSFSAHWADRLVCAMSGVLVEIKNAPLKEAHFRLGWDQPFWLTCLMSRAS
jgi:hypothetical protein